MKYLLFAGYIAATIALFLFSYTQIDLNLTLTQVSVWQGIQQSFQHVGFYQRPLATGLYITILVVLFALYAVLLRVVKKLTHQDVWKFIFLVSGFLVCSYPAAFSYDFFNYLFTAKTVLIYHQNPYIVTPLQFIGLDPWTNFMRWTHLTSAYTPLWIGMSLVPYIIGLGYFLPVLFSMKFMIAGFYLLACWAVWKATKSTHTLVLFALNPLILIESLVSGHNDIVMIAFVMLAVLYRNNWFYLSLSIAAKFMTIVLIPGFLLKKNYRWMLGAMLLGLFVVLLRREFLPWYWVWVIPFIALNNDNNGLVRFGTIVSFGLLLSYAPYFYFGEYSQIEQAWKTSIIWVGVVTGILSYLFPIGNSRISRI